MISTEDKKISTPILLASVILILGGACIYFYFTRDKSSCDYETELSMQAEERVVDGVVEKVEGDQLFVLPQDGGAVVSFLTDDATIFQSQISEEQNGEMVPTSETISLSDIKEGDNVSVVSRGDVSGQRTAAAITIFVSQDVASVLDGILKEVEGISFRVETLDGIDYWFSLTNETAFSYIALSRGEDPNNPSIASQSPLNWADLEIEDSLSVIYKREGSSRIALTVRKIKDDAIVQNNCTVLSEIKTDYIKAHCEGQDLTFKLADYTAFEEMIFDNGELIEHNTIGWSSVSKRDTVFYNVVDVLEGRTAIRVVQMEEN